MNELRKQLEELKGRNEEMLLERRVEKAEEHVKRQNAVKGRANEGFTKIGVVFILENALAYAAKPLVEAHKLLGERHPEQHRDRLNGHLYNLALLLQSALDCIASAAEKLAPSPKPQRMYFRNYKFVLSKVAWISPIQADILDLQFRGKTFFDFANILKHEHAWVGCVCFNNKTKLYDVYDAADCGFFHDVLVRVYIKATIIINQLAQQLEQP
ncbi:hypothetical protein ABPG77_010483 [Micractinium sp. CCAP 211/92]